MIEKSAKMYGGTCINVGCIPTKSLVNSARNTILGHLDGKRAYADAIERKVKLAEVLREKNYKKPDSNRNVDIINGTASFLSDRAVEVETEKGKISIEGERFFINTGSVPFVPPIKGLQDNPRVYISETLLDLETLPERMVIIGAGYIGVEFASIYANFGSNVTIIQDGAVFLPREDAEIAEMVKQSLEDRGVRLLSETKVQEIVNKEEYAEVIVETTKGTKTLLADVVLAATGRRPNTQGLNLEAAGVQTDKRGGVMTDKTRTTTASNIFAMGDVAGGLQFTYISLDDYRIIASKILGDGSYTLDKRGAVPYSVFLDPPFSRVGMNEREAVAAGYEVKIVKLPAAAIPKAQVLNRPVGLLKAVIDAATGKILGAHLFCEESHELINLVKVVMDAGLDYTVFKNMIFTHPTMGEALNDLFDIPQD